MLKITQDLDKRRFQNSAFDMCTKYIEKVHPKLSLQQLTKCILSPRIETKYN